MASSNGLQNVVPQFSRLLQPKQRRHSDAQSRADRLDPSIIPPSLLSEGNNRGNPEILASLLAHTDDALTRPSGFLPAPLIGDVTLKRPSVGLRNHTDASAAAAHWVACQASFVNSQDETTSSTKSHPTRSTQSPAVSTASTASIATTPETHLTGLQSTHLADHDGLKPLAAEEIDPASFDLVAPPQAPEPQFSVEEKSELLLSAEHLQVIFDDPKHMQKFTDFLYALRPDSVPRLNYYLGLVKALKAIRYADAIIKELVSIDKTPSTELPLAETISKSLMSRADETFGVLAREELPAYVTHVWARMVNKTIKQRITNTLPPNLRDLSEGLAGVFCLTDPSRDDNPMVFASEEFHRATQYGRGFALGRNCRFLQGPKTNQHSVRRLKEMLVAGREHCEPLLNYRRDGSVFMNLLMIAPLYDNRGHIRYHLGAQVDVSGLLRECAGLASLGELVVRKQRQSESSAKHRYQNLDELRPSRDVLSDLAETLTLSELRIVQASGNMMYNTHSGKPTSTGSNPSTNDSKVPSLIRDEEPPVEEVPLANSTSSSSVPIPSSPSTSLPSHLRSIFDHYLLVRPCPTLRILFASPSLRVPGILQSPFMSRIGGPQSIRDAISQAFRDGDGITTKIQWLARPMPSGLTPSLVLQGGRSRWIHTTPLLGVNGAVGVWMVVLVDDEEGKKKKKTTQQQRAPGAPPIPIPVKLFSLDRRRPFDVDFGVGVGNPETENLANGPTSEAEAAISEQGQLGVETNCVSVERGRVKVTELGVAYAAGRPGLDGQEWV
ncbi:hypothetical protein F5Y14DRAFT_254105 [Nemania sp. NC0429]|nr:hypothetical protein F5Y14DRAFT_254105 [Nemania sp. NC0429]